MSRRTRNILFIMCDQLRADHLSCYGHPKLHTPHIDALAARGVIFDNAYVQSPVCGPSRMSYYTGRYMHSHGVSWNFVPLKAGEMTIGDHLRPLGVRSVLVGKTHMRGDASGMSRLGIDPDSQVGVRIAECGFDPYERDDGIHPYSGHDPDPSYHRYLREHGFQGDNLWEEWANTVVDKDGTFRSGWYLRYSNLPARIPAEHSETAYTTGRAMDFMREAGDQPWLCHLSFIKPHWPYAAPAPYAGMYTPEDALPVVRSDEELRDPHPVYAAMTHHRVSRTFAQPGIRDAVMVGYMALVKQIDDEMGRLFAFMQERGLLENTMIVFCADHGDFLGDHWLGDKELFHQPVIRTPLIICDPDPRADATRGTRCQALVEAVDLAPTFLDVHGGNPVPHVMDGRSLRPWLFGKPPAQWRDIAVCECDYSFQDARIELQQPPIESWMRMAFDGRWKYVLCEGYRPMLFDLQSDPQELHDLGASEAPEHVDQRRRLHEALFQWARRPRQRVTVSDELIESTEVQARISENGILIGYADEADLVAQRKLFKPRYASHNPLVKETLDRLTREPYLAHAQEGTGA
ncbi:sulfatase-like hydrolase/transferase [Ramlibacter sp. USB13]|uniref:Sulfatase-like hydrolase/transferase n=1 Tax=Ramlibacter cellulosilyticus TaxID=2764187 RepID=A0A923MMP5_9BURK|nr:sulfatase-like hydrolase/transferase [Ramlibacter cellulosilyticus]MBC5781503.1 sulfatase-like hydrolase/transferase [Ramlibacter cellulosilyticus]